MEPNKKYPSVIQQIELNEATFAKSPSKDSTVTDLTCVNFFFGNNGTGKSTIAQAILNDHGITYNPGHSRSDYYLHIYDEDYIKDNIQSYPGMPGLFTMDYVNISMQQEVENKQAEIKELREKQSDNEKHAEEKNKELTKLIKAFRKDVWDKGLHHRSGQARRGSLSGDDSLGHRDAEPSGPVGRRPAPQHSLHNRRTLFPRYGQHQARRDLFRDKPYGEGPYHHRQLPRL